ncbi:MAG TPA: sulfotransferase [Steroidobacteraceae bacterium]|nr:sulfotransferase [Steroidobacteraceae bacterium]
MKPIFIGGCPRSGTTLLGTVLGAHPLCCPVPEAQFKVELLRGLPADPEPAQALRTLQAAMQSPRFQGWKPAAECLRQDGIGEVGSYPELVGRLMAAYVGLAGKREATHWIDGTPSNKNFLPTLLRLFPDARAIHIVRDGRAVANSVMRRDWGPNTVITAAWWWLGHLSHGLAAELSLPSDRIKRIQYEALVRRPKDTLVGLCKWLGLEYSERMLDSRFYTVDSNSAAFNPLTKQAPQDDRADAWRKSLSAREIEIFEAESKEMLTYLGYSMGHGPCARSATFPEKLRMAIAELSLGGARAIAFKARRTSHHFRIGNKA